MTKGIGKLERRHLPDSGRMPLLYGRWGINLSLAAMILIMTCGVAAATAHPQSSDGENEQERYLTYVDSADMFLRNGKWESAESMIRKALKESPANPGNPLLFSNLGVCLSQQKKYGEALEAYEIGLVKAPQSTVILTSRMLTYLAMNRMDDAMADINSALEADSMLRQPRRIRAEINLAGRKTCAAAEDFEFLKRHFPEEATGANGLGRCAMADGHPDAALPLLREAYELEKDEDIKSDIVVDIAACQISLDRLNEADNTVREAIMHYPRKGELYLLRSELHRLRYRNEESELDKKIASEYGVVPQMLEWIVPENIP